jgi:hypothetical protein
LTVADAVARRQAAARMRLVPIVVLFVLNFQGVSHLASRAVPGVHQDTYGKFLELFLTKRGDDLSTRLIQQNRSREWAPPSPHASRRPGCSTERDPRHAKGKGRARRSSKKREHRRGHHPLVWAQSVSQFRLGSHWLEFCPNPRLHGIFGDQVLLHSSNA